MVDTRWTRPRRKFALAEPSVTTDCGTSAPFAVLYTRVASTRTAQRVSTGPDQACFEPVESFVLILYSDAISLQNVKGEWHEYESKRARKKAAVSAAAAATGAPTETAPDPGPAAVA